MLRRLREAGPGLLVPLAWVFAAGAQIELLDEQAVVIGHLVMDVVLATFAVLSWDDMTEQLVLRAWLAVIVAGFVVTVTGTVALVTDASEALVRATVAGWMLLPAVALVYTGRELPPGELPAVYAGGGVLSGLGTAVLVAGSLTGSGLELVAIGLVGIGQTAGIWAAIYTY